jgi:two-component system, OmpR family, sensor kinase
MSIRLRLTLLYSSILALTLILFSGVLYAVQARSSMGIIAQDLRQSAEAMVRAWARFHRGMEMGMGPPRDPRDLGYRDEAQRFIQAVVREEIGRDLVQMLDKNGEPLPLPVNQNADAFSISARALAEMQKGTVVRDIAQQAGTRWLVYNVPVVAGIVPGGEENVVGIVQVARPLADRDRSLRALGMALVLGSLSTTLIAFGIGWFLAGTTLRPIQRITQTAEAIGEARDFSSRVDYEGPQDELGRLAMTFNTMLARLEQAYQQVAHALQVQRDFVADVSHELRTPLTTIRGNLTLLRRDPPLPVAEQADVVEDLSEESERLIRLVQDLLTLARADAGRALDLSPVDVGPLVHDVCRQARILAPARSIVCEAASGSPVVANEDALKQVLLILVDNAIKYGEGPIQVTLDAAGAEVGIRVKDEGPGIPPAMEARLFDRFHRGDVSRSTPGFGLGLAIAQSLVEAQDGRIEVESVVGKGSTFTVWLSPAGGTRAQG